jgi:hypothetical protein
MKAPTNLYLCVDFRKSGIPLADAHARLHAIVDEIGKPSGDTLVASNMLDARRLKKRKSGEPKVFGFTQAVHTDLPLKQALHRLVKKFNRARAWRERGGYAQLGVDTKMHPLIMLTFQKP